MKDDYPRSRLSSFDLGVLARDIERLHNGHVKWELYLPLRKDSGIALLVRVSFHRPSARSGGSEFERGCAGSYPGNGGRTLVGELYRVTWLLAQKLDEEAADAATEPARLPGF